MLIVRRENGLTRYLEWIEVAGTSLVAAEWTSEWEEATQSFSVAHLFAIQSRYPNARPEAAPVEVTNVTCNGELN
jgi:hypothetical protein